MPRVPSYRPWNSHLCRNSRYPSTYLTFSFGANLPIGRAHLLIQLALAHLAALIAEGHATKYFQWPGYELARDERYVIYALPASRQVWTQVDSFTVQQAVEVVGLLEWCGVARGYGEEMWAYVFVAEVQVGYVWMARDPLVVGGI